MVKKPKKKTLLLKKRKHIYIKDILTQEIYHFIGAKELCDFVKQELEKLQG